jgi:hypothetical protein
VQKFEFCGVEDDLLPDAVDIQVNPDLLALHPLGGDEVSGPDESEPTGVTSIASQAHTGSERRSALEEEVEALITKEKPDLGTEYGDHVFWGKHVYHPTADDEEYN